MRTGKFQKKFENLLLSEAQRYDMCYEDKKTMRYKVVLNNNINMDLKYYPNNLIVKFKKDNKKVCNCIYHKTGIIFGASESEIIFSPGNSEPSNECENLFRKITRILQ